MFEECVKLKKTNNSLVKQLDGLSFEKESLCKQLHDLIVVCDSIKLENSRLVDQLDCLVASQNDVPHEFSVKLENILSFQKPYGNRCGLGIEN